MDTTRRRFIGSLLYGGAGLLFGNARGRSARVTVPPNPSQAAAHRVFADLHVHAMMNEWISQTPPAVEFPAVGKLAKKFLNPTKFSWNECHRAGIDVLCVTHFNVFDEWLSMPTDPNPEAPANTIRMMDMLEDELNGTMAPYARLARNAAELESMLAVPRRSEEYRIAVVHTVEGGHALGGDIGAVELFARRGVALMTITHFFNKGISSAANAFPFFPDENSRWPHQGLYRFGLDVIKEMERLGMIVDVTHATNTAMDDILRHACKPLVATHTSARTLADRPYCLLDEHIQEIAKRRGLIGIILYPYDLSNYANDRMAEKKGTLLDVARVVRHVAKICGTHTCIGIGSDFCGYIKGPKDMMKLGEIDKLRRTLLDEFDKDEKIVEDIMANNVIHFLRNNWKTGIHSPTIH